MKISSILVCITMVGIAIKICNAKYLLVEIDDATKTGKLCCILSSFSLFKNFTNYGHFRYVILEFSIDTSLGKASRLNNTSDLLKKRKVTEPAKENTRSEGRKCSMIILICGN